MKDRLFYQDFLYHDMQVDKEDYPDIELEFCTDVAEYRIENIKIVPTFSEATIELNRLMNIRKEEDWKLLEENISKLEKVIIEDDIEIKNPELNEYKLFFLKTYFWRFKQCCRECYIKSR